MNERALSGVLMLGAAGVLAWAWLTGRLDKQIAEIVGIAQGKKVAPLDARDEAQRRGERSGR